MLAANHTGYDAGMSLAILPLVVGPLQSNCVILADTDTLDAVVVDPGDEADAILRVIRANRYHCRAILNTHAHIDHVGANHPVKAATGASVYLHTSDQPLYEMMPAQAEALAGMLPVPQHVPVDVLINDGDRLQFGPISIEVIHTPGHSPGSVCSWSTASLRRCCSPATRFSREAWGARTCGAAISIWS